MSLNQAITYSRKLHYEQERAPHKIKMKLMGHETSPPRVYDYHDYVLFLRDQLQYVAVINKNLSLRNLARRSGLSPSLISLVLSRKRKLSKRNLEKLLMVLKLKPSEEKFALNLYDFVESDSFQGRLDSLKKIQNFKAYRERHQGEIETIRYLSDWSHVTLREMSRLAGFSLDENRIKKSLCFFKDVKQLKKALNFLKKNHYLGVGIDKPILKEKIVCDPEVHKIALLDFHRQMLMMACDALVKQSAEERLLEGFTFSIKKENLSKVQSILTHALDEIEKLEAPEGEADFVCHSFVGNFQLAKAESNLKKESSEAGGAKDESAKKAA